MTTFVLVDKTGGATTSDGAALTPVVLAQIAWAVQVQLNRDVDRETGGGPFLVRVSDGADVQPGEVVFTILPDLPDPGAVADHVNLGGAPAAFDAITASDSLTGPGNSLSVAISHELCEIAGDPGCNRWADRLDGTEVALEECDAVEAQTYDIGAAASPPGTTGIHVSNFVLRSFWDPGSKGPFDFMTSRGIDGAVAPSGPMQAAPSGGSGNYQLVRQTSAQSVHQVTAMGTPRRPWRSGSRRHRRGVEAESAKGD